MSNMSLSQGTADFNNYPRSRDGIGPIPKYEHVTNFILAPMVGKLTGVTPVKLDTALFFQRQRIRGGLHSMTSRMRFSKMV